MVDPESQTGTQARAQQDPLCGASYKLLRRVTSGAMGEILEAEHVPLRRKVIVKLVHRAYATVPGFVDRFRLEAQSLATLAPRTPHIVAVLDFGESADGRPFLVMEHLLGRTLGDELRARHMLPPTEAVDLTRGLLDALRCAHEVGIVHRDVKPENIFLAESERGGRVLKLLDFGIAKVLATASPDDAPAPLALPTAEGMMLGTPRFLSPEQACGLSVDHRADLYAAGAVLYAMLTGRDPFAHVEGLRAVLQAQVLELPRPPSMVATQPIPDLLDRIVIKALAKRPEHRFASAAEFVAALDGALAGGPVTGRGGTERMDVTAFRGAGRGRRAPPFPDKTEPVDVSVFCGALRVPPSAPKRAAPTPASPVPPASSVVMSPWQSPQQPVPEPVRSMSQRPAPMAVAVIFVGLLAAASVLIALVALARLR